MADDITLRQVRYFLAALDQSTMAAAAQHLHVSPSAISLAISDLEDSLGTDLLIRTPRQPLALTTAGHSLAPQMRRLVADADDLRRSAERAGRAPSGALRVGCFRTLAPIHLPRLVSEMSRTFPDIELEVVEATLQDLQAQLLAGTIESAVMYELDVAAGIETEVLLDTRPHVLVGSSHRFASRSSVALAELREDPMVMLDVHPSEVYFRTLLGERGIPPKVVRTTGSFETLRSFVARDVGWSMLIGRPDIAVSYEGLPIHHLEIEDPIDPMPIVLATPAGIHPTARATAFRTQAKALFKRRT